MMAGSGIERATVFGGTGFLGRAIVARCLAEGLATRVAARRPDSASTGDAEPIAADVRDETAVARAVAGSDLVVNAVGLYVETDGADFEAVHVGGAANVAAACASRNVDHLIHISGIGVDRHSKSAYVRARAVGEERVREVFREATILRPSVLFDADGGLLDGLAKFARATPIVPLFGRGRIRLQPVHRRDVAEAVLRAAGRAGAGGIYELGGPRTYRYRELVEIVCRETGRRRLLLPVPFALWDLLALLASVLPDPPLTPAQVTLMRHDNSVASTALSFEDLDIVPTALEEVLPRIKP